MSKNILFISDTIIKERSIVNTNTDPKLIYPDIKAAQDMYILPVLGTALFNKIQTAVNANDWTGLTNYKTLLDDYIIDPLVYYVMAELPMNSYQFTNKGIMRKQGDNTELPSMADLISISNRYRDRAEHYTERLRRYLLEKAPTLFPEYLNPGNTIDTVLPKQSSFTMPVYLGDIKDPWCNPGGFTGKPYSE